MAKCPPDASWPQMQERQETTIRISLIDHQDKTNYVLNMHALHNAHLLRKILPQRLVQPVSLHGDQTAREAHHHAIAATLWVTQTEKWARTAAKRKATNNAKKRAKEREAVVESGSEQGEGNEQAEGSKMVVDQPARSTGAGQKRRRMGR